MYQGATLPAAVVHLLSVDHKPKMSDMMAAYVECSRVKTKETILIAEPFNPALFCLGPPPGPRIYSRCFVVNSRQTPSSWSLIAWKQPSEQQAPKQIS